jgi:hypothetical protein
MNDLTDTANFSGKEVDQFAERFLLKPKPLCLVQSKPIGTSQRLEGVISDFVKHWISP